MSICVKFNEQKVHELYPEASMIPAMKIWSLPKNKADRLKEYCDSGDYIASLKIDGYYYMFNKTPNHNYLFSRSPGVNGLLTEKSGNIPHIVEAFSALPADTVLIGEIFVPKGTSKDVTRIMGSLPEKAIERQNTEGLINYYLTDIIMLGGEDLRNRAYEERLAILFEVYANYNLKDYDFLSISIPIYSNIYDVAQEFLAAGEEGVVLRKKSSPFEADKRPAWSSIKIKQANTIDAIITGFCDPTKEYTGTELDSWGYYIEDIPVTKAYYYGWKNAIKIAAYDDEGNLVEIGTIASGLTDELREAFSKNPEKYLNMVIEIQCMSVDTISKTLRHGYFKKFREDKSPDDCKISEIFA